MLADFLHVMELTGKRRWTVTDPQDCWQRADHMEGWRKEGNPLEWGAPGGEAGGAFFAVWEAILVRGSYEAEGESKKSKNSLDACRLANSVSESSINSRMELRSVLPVSSLIATNVVRQLRASKMCPLRRQGRSASADAHGNFAREETQCGILKLMEDTMRAVFRCVSRSEGRSM